MPLDTYRKKRNFSRTSEPEAGGRRGGRIFVVQLHHASRRHYDFRLELDGVLKSWAVPKGPSFDPAVRRLAVEVEDHPIAYAAFEGDIAEGNYGAGHVNVFDSGTWEAEGSAREDLAKGDLKFTLHGRILKGSWVLVRTRMQGGKQQWLLIKHRDAFANKTEADDYLDADPAPPPPRTKRAKAGPGPPQAIRLDDASTERGKRERASSAAFEPELCRPVERPPAGDGWLHEAKWDGYRLLAAMAKGKLRLWSRNGIEWTQRLPELVAAIGSLDLHSARLDGEIIVLRDGRDSFNALQARLAGDTDEEILYMLFDVLHADGRSFADLPLSVRKQWLAARLAAHPHPLLRYSEHEIGHGVALFAQATARGIEGLVSKRVDSRYRGGRSGDWVKCKARLSDEFVVVGFTEPKGSRSGLGALLLGKPQRRGFRYAGRVGTGIDDRQLRSLRRRLDESVVEKPSVATGDIARKDLVGARWVEPSLVVEVFYQGIGGRGLLRQAAFKGLRDDRSVADVSPDALAGAPVAKRAASGRAARRKETPMKKSESPITHPERIVYPKLDLSKQDVADYYRAVAPWLIPQIGNRPLSVVRCPGGIGESCFFQKHAPKAAGSHVHGVMIREKSGRNRYLCIEDVDGLLELVQLNTLEFHPWGAHSDDPERADRIVFDLDPDTSVSWAAVKQAARDLRGQLESIGLKSFVRTSGGKGLHVVVPLEPRAPWEEVKAFARAAAEAMVSLQPDRFVSVADKPKRKDKIFIDWLRNAHGATSVASYSLRARPGAGVAMPLRWEDLARLRKPDQFTLKNALAAVKRRRKDPWAEMDTTRQSIPDF